MSKTLTFVEKYQGKIVDVEPGWGYPGECVSLVQRFIIEELGVKAKARGNGKGWRTTLINEGLGKRVDRKDIRIGDIIAWDGKLGHVAIALGGDKIFEQIGPRGKAKIGSIAYWDRIQPAKGVVTRLNDFVDEIPKPQKEKTIDELAREVIDGKHGNGQARVKSLGDKYDEVQKRVNDILKPKPKPVSNVGKTWRNILKPLPLYDGNGKRYKTPSRVTRNYKILAEKGDFYQIQHFLFKPQKVWVRKIDGKVV